jgi:hypothetical protein
MTSYDIHRWDAVREKIDVPALYILPDAALMEHIRSNNFEIPIKIVGTKSKYDTLVMAKCIPSQDAGGYRPNFQADTNYICLLPNLAWAGYPIELGQVHTLAEAKSTETSGNIFTDTIDYFRDRPEKQMYLWYVIMAIIVLFLIVCGTVVKTQENYI